MQVTRFRHGHDGEPGTHGLEPKPYAVWPIMRASNYVFGKRRLDSIASLSMSLAAGKSRISGAPWPAQRGMNAARAEPLLVFINGRVRLA
jgi:hypothetical protein